MFFLRYSQMCWSPTQLVCSESIFVRYKANAILYYMCAKKGDKEPVSPYLYYFLLISQSAAFLTSSSPISNEERTAYKLSASNLFAGDLIVPQGPSLVRPDSRESCRELSISLYWVVYFSNPKLTFWVTEKTSLAHFICLLVPQASQLAIPSMPFFLTSKILEALPQKVWSCHNLLYLKINQPSFGPFPFLHPIFIHPKA